MDLEWPYCEDVHVVSGKMQGRLINGQLHSLKCSLGLVLAEALPVT